MRVEKPKFSFSRLLCDNPETYNSDGRLFKFNVRKTYFFFFFFFFLFFYFSRFTPTSLVYFHCTQVHSHKRTHTRTYTHIYTVTKKRKTNIFFVSINYAFLGRLFYVNKTVLTVDPIFSSFNVVSFIAYNFH